MIEIKDEYSEREREKAVDAALDFQGAQGISQREFCRLAGIANGTWRMLLNGRIRQPDPHVRQVVAFLREQVERRAAPPVPFAETRLAERMMQVCRTAHDAPCMGLIIAEPGAGKSATLREYERRAVDRVVYVQAGVALASPYGLLLELVDRMGVSGRKSRNTGDLYRMVRDHLARWSQDGQRASGLLLIDEATNLTPRAMEMLRNLHDDRQANAAIVLADTRRLSDELDRVGRVAGGYAQLRRRLGAVWTHQRSERGEMVCREDVRLVAETALRGLDAEAKLDRHAVDYLHRRANVRTGGCLGNAVAHLQAVWAFGQQTGRAVEYSVADMELVAPMVGATRVVEARPAREARAGEANAA